VMVRSCESGGLLSVQGYDAVGQKMSKGWMSKFGIFCVTFDLLFR
jgi:hypothetical protein